MTPNTACNYAGSWLKNCSNKAALLTCSAYLAYSLGWQEADGIKPATEQLTLFRDLSAEEKVIFDIIDQHKSPLAIDDLTINQYANEPIGNESIEHGDARFYTFLTRQDVLRELIF